VEALRRKEAKKRADFEDARKMARISAIKKTSKENSLFNLISQLEKTKDRRTLFFRRKTNVIGLYRKKEPS